MSTSHSTGRNSPAPFPPGAKQGWRPSILVFLIFMNFILIGLLLPTVSLVLFHKEAAFRDAQLNRTINHMRYNLENRSASLVRTMTLSASEALAGYDFSFLNNLARQVTETDPEIVYCLVMDSQRQVLAHSNPQKVGTTLDDKLDRELAADMMRESMSRESRRSQADSVQFHETVFEAPDGNQHILEAVMPVYSGGRLTGMLRCAFSLSRLESETRMAKLEWTEKMRQQKLFFVSMTFFVLLLGIIVATIFTRTFVKSVRQLNEGVLRVTRGDLRHPLSYEGMFCQEFIELTNAFNNMTDKLRDSYRQLDDYSKSLEQKVADRTRDLEEAQANLMRQAHEAGMAEMAVGILHNIGNAITPAKVGVALLLKKLRASPLLNRLPEAISRIGQAVADNPNLPSQEKKRLLGILELLPDSIKEEYERTMAEIELLRNKHEHIENIIDLQLRYARLHGDTQEVEVNLVIEDALKILGEFIANRQIRVEKLYSEVPPVKIEQAKLIQLVVNLIKNACEAMEGQEATYRCLTISTYQEEGDPSYVCMAFRDMGIGFLPAEKEKLFQFGYTSKEKGSGFGLHSCANFVIANKGTITAYSAGRNQGAVFTIRLPAMEG